MENESWRRTLSENLSALRKKHGMTQSELGEKLNYTDKSVSKWERGDGVPDLGVLVQLSDMYNVGLDEMLGRGKTAEESAEKNLPKHPVLHQTSILMIMGSFIVILAFIAYFVISLAWPGFAYAWMSFVIALPCLFIAAGVWFMVWRHWAWAFGCMSVALWTLCVCLDICLPIRSALIYVCGGILQLVSIVLCGFGLLKKSLS